MSMIRPAGSGRDGTASTFMRTIASPRAAIVLASDAAAAVDWPEAGADAEANLNHAAGWVCEVRKHDVVLLDPLGEGIIRAPVPDLPPAWLDNVRHDGSCAVFVAPTDAEAGFAELTVASAAATGLLRGATVRSSVAAEYGSIAPVGRNQPCPCGSGKKYKHCHG